MKKKPITHKKPLKPTKSKKTWKQRQKRKNARAKASSTKSEHLHGSKFFKHFEGSYWSKEVRQYIIFDEKNDRYIVNVGNFVVGINPKTRLEGNKTNYSVGPKSKAMKFSIPDRSLYGWSINYIIGDIKHTGAWRTIRIK